LIKVFPGQQCRIITIQHFYLFVDDEHFRINFIKTLLFENISLNINCFPNAHPC